MLRGRDVGRRKSVSDFRSQHQAGESEGQSHDDEREDPDPHPDREGAQAQGAGMEGKEDGGMKTAGFFADLFTMRTTGTKRMYTINALTLDAVKIVLQKTKLNLDAPGTGCYGGTDGYLPTAKGYRAILALLK